MSAINTENTTHSQKDNNKFDTIAKLDLVSMTTAQLDEILGQFDVAIKASKDVKIMFIKSQLAMHNLTVENSSLSSQLSTVSKKVKSKKVNKTDQCIAKFRLMLSDKLDSSDFLDFSSDNKKTGQKIRSICFTLGIDDVKYGFSVSQLTKQTCTDFALSYNLGAHVVNFGCIAKVQPLINVSTGQLSKKYSAKNPIDGCDYDKNEWSYTLTFIESIEDLANLLVSKKTGQRIKTVTDEKMPSESTMSIVSDNFEKSAAEILRLVLDSMDTQKSDDSENTDVSDDSEK